MNGNRDRTDEPAGEPASLASSDGVDRPAGWLDLPVLLSIFRRRLGLFLAVLGGAVGLSLLFTAAQARLYTATAEVVLDMRGDQAAPDARSAQAGAATENRVNTEVRVLRSLEMAQAVAGRLRLDRDAAFLRPDGLWARLTRPFGLRSEPPPHDEAVGRAVDRLRAGLDVGHPDRTYALTIGYTATDPRTAARIANAYARQYVGQDAVRPGAPDRSVRRLISSAEPPVGPSSPRPLVNLAVATVIGAILGFVAAVQTERMFAGLTGSDDVERRLGLHHLGNVPTLASVLPAARSALDAVADEPMSAFAEAFRSVMMAARHAGGRGTQVFAITSALPNEGKTTIAACLARSVALSGESVVLVDCDARRRDLSALFGKPGARPGLAQVLRQEATLDEALLRDEASGAWILPLTGGPAELSDLLAGAPMDALIGELRQRFKRVLIDTAPVLAVSATRAITTMADLVLLVVRWRVTPDHAVKAALRLIPSRFARVGGVVLSQVDMTKQIRYGRGDPAFYYRQYSDYYS